MNTRTAGGGIKLEVKGGCQIVGVWWSWCAWDGLAVVGDCCDGDVVCDDMRICASHDEAVVDTTDDDAL